MHIPILQDEQLQASFSRVPFRIQGVPLCLQGSIPCLEYIVLLTLHTALNASADACMLCRLCSTQMPMLATCGTTCHTSMACMSSMS